MFTFTTSGFFWFLTACTIPIIIHLLFRRRYQRIRWAAMQFLLVAYRNTKSTLLLENIILLILRILVLLILVLIFSRPKIKVASDISSATQKNNFIFVLDNSYSMGLRGNNTSCFEKAKFQGRSIIEQIQKNDTISVLVMNHTNEVKNSALLSTGKETVVSQAVFIEITSDKIRQDILKFWDDIKLSEVRADIPTTFDNLYELIKNPEHSNKRVFIFSDFQKNSWERITKNPRYREIMKSIQQQSSAFTLVDTGIPDPQNLGITDFDFDGVITTNVPTRFITKISNYGSKSYQDISITFSINGQKQKTEYFSIGPKQDQEISFYATFVQSGNHYVSVELSPDNLMLDNIRHLSLEVIEQIRILIVDGDPKPNPFESESDYFVAALGDLSSGFIQITKVTPNDLGPKINLKNFDVVILANLSDVKYFLGIELNRQTMLENFVKNGGGLWIWLGEKVSSTTYNDDLYNFREILPGKLDQPIGNVATDKNFTTYTIDHLETHRVWRYFFENPKLLEDLKQCYIYRYYNIEIPKEELSENVSILATYRPGNHPAILERRMGKGKIILSSTTLDREWNNFHTDQYGHVFVILVNEFLQYLVGRPYQANNVQTQIPFLKDYDFYVEAENVTILTPTEEIKTPQWKPIKTLENLPNTAIQEKDIYRMYYSDTNRSGVYRLRFSISNQILQERPDLTKFILSDLPNPNQTRKQLQEYFVVNVPADEGNIQCYTQQEFSQQLANAEIKYEKNMEEKIRQASKKDTEYWKTIAWILLIMGLLETFLAMWFGRYNK